MGDAPDTSTDAFRRHLTAHLSSGTAEKYAGGVRYFADWLSSQGVPSLEAMPPRSLSAYSEWLAQQGLQPATIQWYLVSARRYLRWCKQLGIRVPEMYEPELPRIKRRIGALLPATHLARYQALAGELLREPYTTAVRLAPYIGVRTSELASLRLDSLSRCTLLMRGRGVDAIVIKVVSKGGDEKLVPLLEEGKPILFEYLQGWRRHQRGPYLFPRQRRRGEGHIMDRTLRAAMQRLCDPLGMDFSPQTMRRTYLVTLWRRGVDITVIAKIAGHKSIQTTFKSYLALDEQDILRNVFRDNKEHEHG